MGDARYRVRRTLRWSGAALRAAQSQIKVNQGHTTATTCQSLGRDSASFNRTLR